MEKVEWERISNKLVRWQMFVLIFSMILTGVIVLWVFKKLPPQIPIYYSRPWGENQLGRPVALLIPLIFSQILCLVTIKIKPDIKIDQAIKAMLFGTALVAETIMLGAVIRIIYVML